MTRPSAQGAIACGHPATAAAAGEILAEGGNAFDAVLAGFAAATVAEPVLASLAGGGFLLAQPAEGEARLYDFFVQTPRQRLAPDDLAFYPIHADFGPATQEFHIGLGSVATPGAVAGLFAIHRDLCRLPVARLFDPAVRLAREGFSLRPIDAYTFRVIGPILQATAEARDLFQRADGTLPETGERWGNPQLGDSLEALAAEGPGLFYGGELGQNLVAACRTGGGQITAADLAGYRVKRRRPLERPYRQARILTNPPPSSGGILIAFALALLAGQPRVPQGFGAIDHAQLLVQAMALTNRARIESKLHEAMAEAEEAAAAARLLDPGLMARYAAEVEGQAICDRGTTHLSVIDAAGNVAAMSLSNGEGCGTLLPGSGIMLNNMLGEEDLNPKGFHLWPENSRISSMMAPTLATLADGTVIALGSGGSNRIRTAILQVLVDLIDLGLSPSAAVEAPRLHHEAGLTNAEAGFPPEALAAVAALSDQVMDWPAHSFFFGGVHAAARGADGRLAAAADPRREGAGLVI